MDRIDKMVQWVTDIVNSGKYKYSQDSYLRWGNGYYDCSSFMITALRMIGINTYNAANTGSMYSELKKSPELDILEFKNVYQLQKGDILLKHISGSNGHTVMYIGNNKVAEARGTQAGLVIDGYYASKWQYVIRVKNNFAIKDTNKCFSEFPVLRNGSKNLYVGLLQLVLKNSVVSHLVIDNEFGDKTELALREYQKKYSLEVDGICGEKTWKKMNTTMELSC